MVRSLPFIALTLILTAPVLAGGETPQPLTLDAAIEEVLSQNPDVRAAHHRTQEAEARVPQAKTLEDPEVGIQFYDVPIDTLDVKQGAEISYRVEQKLPFPGKRLMKGKAAKKEATAQKERGRGAIAEIILDLKKTYYGLYRFDRSLEVNREAQSLFNQYLQSAKTAYGAGEKGAEAPLRAQVELSRLQGEEIDLNRERLTHLSHLKALLNRRTHDEIRLPEKLDWPAVVLSLDQTVNRAIESRPELKALQAMTERDRKRLAVARLGLLPDLSAELEYNQRPSQQDTWTGTAMINLPIFFWRKNRGEINEAKASLRATEAEQESLLIHTRHEIEQAYRAAEATREIVMKFEKEILPAARTTVTAARTAYSAGDVDFLTLVDATRTSLELEMDYLENQSRWGIYHAELERLVGADLQRKEKP